VIPPSDPVAGLDVRAPEVAQVIKELADSRKQLNKELRREHKAIANDLAVKINRRAASKTFGDAWAGTGAIGGARLYLRPKAGGGGALSRFAGRKPLTRSGWNAASYKRGVKGVRLRGRRYVPPDRHQARPWIGNQWIVGRPGEGPYVVRDVAPAETPRIAERYKDAFERATSKVWGHK